jgi:hypothetical protein
MSTQPQCHIVEDGKFQGLVISRHPCCDVALATVQVLLKIKAEHMLDVDILKDV